MTRTMRAAEPKRRGIAAIELAMLLPFLMFLAIMAADWARVLHYTMEVENCARNGALWACDSVAQSRSKYSNVHDAALAEAPELASVATVTSSNLTDGGDGQKAVQVTVSMPFTTLINFKYPKWFGISNSQTITRTVQMRTMPLTPN